MATETYQDVRPQWTAIAEAFQAGDGPAADAAARELLPYVAALVRRLTAWRPDVDDLTQDVLVAALAARRSFRGEARFETWITRIAINHCRAHARKQWIRRRLFAAWAGRKQRAAACEPPADAAAVMDEQAARVREAIAALPAKYREAVVLRYLQELSVAEAAQALGVSRGAVEARLSRARQRLRETLSVPAAPS